VEELLGGRVACRRCKKVLPLDGGSDRRGVSGEVSAQWPQKRVYGGECELLVHVVTLSLPSALQK
jgi:hypothetical protein